MRVGERARGREREWAGGREGERESWQAGKLAGWRVGERASGATFLLLILIARLYQK